jgi:hypothetical protein
MNHRRRRRHCRHRHPPAAARLPEQPREPRLGPGRRRQLAARAPTGAPSCRRCSWRGRCLRRGRGRGGVGRRWPWGLLLKAPGAPGPRAPARRTPLLRFATFAGHRRRPLPAGTQGGNPWPIPGLYPWKPAGGLSDTPPCPSACPGGRHAGRQAAARLTLPPRRDTNLAAPRRRTTRARRAPRASAAVLTAPCVLQAPDRSSASAHGLPPSWSV